MDPAAAEAKGCGCGKPDCTCKSLEQCCEKANAKDDLLTPSSCECCKDRCKAVPSTAPLLERIESQRSGAISLGIPDAKGSGL